MNHKKMYKVTTRNFQYIVDDILFLLIVFPISLSRINERII